MSEKLNTTPHSESEPDITDISELPPEQRFRVDPDKFYILKHQLGPDREQWNIDRTLETYLTDTAQLIATIDGSASDLFGEKTNEPYEHIIYLDKSARPASWLVNILWQDLATKDPSSPSEAVSRPPHTYLNIDRVDWFRRIGTEITPEGNGPKRDGTFGRLGPEDFDADKVTPEQLAGIRALFIDGGIESEDTDTIMSIPTILDGKRLLIVDEVKNSGSTLEIAKTLLKKAIPELTDVDGTYFWETSGTKKVGDEIQMGNVPIWYNARDAYGRGIGDVDPAYHEGMHQAHQTKRTRARKLGSFAIGAPHGQVDQKARDLATDFKTLRSEFQSGRVLFAPPLNYDSDRRRQVLENQGFYRDENSRFSTYADFRSNRDKPIP